MPTCTQYSALLKKLNWSRSESIKAKHHHHLLLLLFLHHHHHHHQTRRMTKSNHHITMSFITTRSDHLVIINTTRLNLTAAPQHRITMILSRRPAIFSGMTWNRLIMYIIIITRFHSQHYASCCKLTFQLILLVIHQNII